MLRRPLALLAGAALTALVAAAPAAAGPPTAVAVDAGGIVYAGDATSGVVARMDFTGTALPSWGAPGSADGQLRGIISLDVDPSGNVWVLDTDNRVQQFTKDGAFLRRISLPACTRGTPPFAPGFGGLDATASAVVVASPCSDRVYRYGADGSGPQASWAVRSPRGVAVQGGDVVVARWNDLDVQVFDLSGALKRTQPIGGQPADVFVDTFGVLHVSDVTKNVIHMFGSDGVEFRTLGRPGANAGDLSMPYAFDVGQQGVANVAGDLFIADHGNARVQRWNSFGSTFWAKAVDFSGGGVMPPPPPPPPVPVRVGVTINDAAAFTSSRQVTLSIGAPAGATQVVLSNDGGFGAASTVPVAAGGRYPWTLASTGADRLPKTVYVRFVGPGIDPSTTLTDDVVLDATAPSVQSAALVTAARTARASGRPTVRLRVRARDANSGVALVQVSSDRRQGSFVRYSATRTLSAPVTSSRTVYVRAIDRAGNAGRWVRATRR